MENKPYYLAYEKRYKSAYEAGAERWGHSPEDEELYATLKAWVKDNHLKGKGIVEFACGEGAGGTEIKVGKPKSATSKRTVPLNSAALESVRNLRGESHFG